MGICMYIHTSSSNLSIFQRFDGLVSLYTQLQFPLAIFDGRLIYQREIRNIEPSYYRTAILHPGDCEFVFGCSNGQQRRLVLEQSVNINRELMLIDAVQPPNCNNVNITSVYLCVHLVKIITEIRFSID